VLASGTPDHIHVFVRVDERIRRLVVNEARLVHGDVRQANKPSAPGTPERPFCGI
jgi:hypothetical protein